MKCLFAISFAFAMAMVPVQLFAKADTVRITIKGNGLQFPIEITDAKSLANFRVWTGPGTSSSEARSFIVDWARGSVAAPPLELAKYQVSFYAKLPNYETNLTERLIYVVSYAYDPATRQGYVYLPGKTELWYQLNTSTILHGVEGKWFRAWDSWDRFAAALIERPSSAGTTLRSNQISR